jgi:hypothetical protein
MERDDSIDGGLPLAGPGLAHESPDNPANRDPVTWMAVRSWGYAAPRGGNLNVLVPLAAAAEMCDRTYYDVWNPDLSSVLRAP